MLVGAGKTGELALLNFSKRECKSIYVTNRTFHKAEKIASKYHGTAIEIEKMEEYLPLCDIVLVATSSKKQLITSEMVEKSLQKNDSPKLYIDLSFYRDLKHRFAAPGDFAQAYVIAHEVAHHVQTLMGISQKVHELRQQVGEVEANALSVRMELQADCLAGLWAHHAQRMNEILEPGDIDEALNAASAIGDDRLQRQGRGTVVPDTFTHGSSAQRVRWFKLGLESGELQSCDTFNAEEL